ncbi:unnamed protein product [Cuscuta campestris]|uniref:DOG1 domain-containing protein n=1 Tax=Cuscuta campestris TaxID=132261 RepID=A0A484K0I5_9ASTE|nr:unnamed protein product [Cuscuta campestris]
MGSERALFELHGDEEDDDNNNNHNAATVSGGEDDNKVFVGVPIPAAAAPGGNQISFAHHHYHYPHTNNNQISFGMLHSSPSSSTNFMSKDSSGGAYDLGELDQALFLYLDGHQEPSSSIQDQRRADNCGMRPPTLNIFPSQPMHVDPSSSSTTHHHHHNNKESGGMLVSSLETEAAARGNAKNEVASLQPCASVPNPPKGSTKREGSRRSSSSTAGDHDSPKTPDPKTLRRLAQNREAARKSRLRKKAYVQQLETSRIKLTQLEQEIQRARAQGIYFGGGSLLGGEQGLPLMGNISSDAAVFDLEYARWMEEDHRLMCELRGAVQEHLPENELRLYVDNCLAHYDQMFSLKNIILKSDVFHLVSGMWRTPAERCFMWMGGFRPSELLKVIIGQIEPITEQQLIGLCGLQQSTHEAEEALSQGLAALNQSLSDTIIASDSLLLFTYANNSNIATANFMAHMSAAVNKLAALEGFVRQHLMVQTVCFSLLMVQMSEWLRDLPLNG